ncbi:MAG: hypothetical protein ABI175_19760 [Polyangiales bacterium]
MALAALLGASLSPVACGGCRGSKGQSEAGVAASSSSAVDGAPLGASSTEAAWVEARTGDPLELARLADAVPTDDLARIAADDSASEDDRKTAIKALAFVPDPTLALPALSRIVIGASVERSTLALETIAEVAPVRAPIEEAEPPAWKECAVALLAALKTIQGTPRRELAIRALLGLADRGAIDHALVPQQ